MSNINLTCDVCGREVFGCTFVNGMKFCAKCYQETFGETDKDRKIADLEAKLAEKTLTIEQINKAFIENRSLWKGKYEQSNQDKISFAVDILEELADCSNYINSKLDFECGSIIPKEIYEKAKKKCEEADTTIYELIKAVIYELANGEIRIVKRQELTHKHEDK